ncbi:MAG: phosphatidylserine decarboxylase family protein [Syntrophomonadaceae bacterium]
MKHDSLIAREGWIFIAIPGLIAIILCFTDYYLWSSLFWFLALFCVFFFRNPRRVATGNKNLVFAPADGRVLEVRRVEENRYMQGEALLIRIFLSLFNVHINRVPLTGKVEWIEKREGLFISAYKPEASEKNACNYLGMMSEYGKVLVIQITGLVARRIVCWAKPGQTFETGERFGLIRFGSCTELYLPLSAEPMVKPGDKVKGGETVVARFTE